MKGLLSVIVKGDSIGIPQKAMEDESGSPGLRFIVPIEGVVGRFRLLIGFSY